MPTCIVSTVYDENVRAEVLSLLDAGMSIGVVATTTGVSRSTIRSWRDRPEPTRARCVVCAGAVPWPGAAYATLLGFYLGDGCISRHGTHVTLRVSCDAALPGVVETVSEAMQAVTPGTVGRVLAPGTVVVHNGWKHWPCLFPQHGPGRKHERSIALEPWQVEIVEAHPSDFLRGLFHSDGARVRNWATRTVAGERKRYDYARWQFVNASEDILGLCTWALDLVAVRWRRSAPRVLSVSRREAVARLDDLIGPKG